MRHILYDLYQARIMGRDKLGYSIVDETANILWATLQSHELMAEFSKNEIKRYPYVTYMFFRFLTTDKISEPLQDIYQVKRDIKVMSTKSDRHHGRLANIEELGKPVGWVL